MDALLTQFRAIAPLDWLGMASGLAAVWLSIREKALAWPLFIICYAIYVQVSLRSGYFAFAGLNLVFIFISLYGWMKWRRPEGGGADPLPVGRTSPAQWPWVLAFLLGGTVAIALLLSAAGEARLPWLDALACSFALVAQWMLSRKRFETWYFWIASDCIYLVLFFDLRHWPSIILFASFLVLALKGIRDWKPLLKT